MNRKQIAKKISRSLINSAEIYEIPGIIGELKKFSQLIDANRQLKLLFAGHIFSEDEKNRALDALFLYLKLSPRTEKFLKLIILQGYLSAIKEIIITSTNIYNERQNKASAIVISPVVLEKKYTERLKVALKDITKKEIDIDNQIDISLLGGFVVKVGSTIYDSSIKGQLRLLKAKLVRQI